MRSSMCGHTVPRTDSTHHNPCFHDELLIKCYVWPAVAECICVLPDSTACVGTIVTGTQQRRGFHQVSLSRVDEDPMRFGAPCTCFARAENTFSGVRHGAHDANHQGTWVCGDA